MRGTVLAILAVVLRLPAAAQLVSVHEPGIRVAIPTGPATVTIPVDNPLRRAAKGTLAVSWLDVSGKESPPLEREVDLPHGRSEHVFAPPLESPSIWTRLRYSLVPDRTAARNFPPRAGIVSLAHVSPDVFEVKISHPGYSRGGAPFLVHAVATHPVTRLPVSGVEWSGTLEIDDQQLRSASIRSLGEGFAEIRFDPSAPSAEGSSRGDLTITARRGGFEAEAEANPNFGPALTALIQTDKPIYQPGQTIGVRAVVTGPDGRAASGAKVVIKIVSDRNDLTHTAERTASRHGVIHDEWRIPDNAEPDTLRVNLLRPGTGYPSLAIHQVRLSRYELPAFTVTVKPDRAYYSASQRASLTVNASYLFGKPVPKAEVRVTREDTEVAKGTAADDGSFAAQVDLPADAIREWQRFHDIRFAAFARDPSTGRSAQREFRIRVSRDPIHIYPFALRGLESGQAALYVSASYADGRPAPATITWKSGTASGEIRTNRYGVGKGRVPDDFTGDGPVEWHARDAAGLEGQWREQVHDAFRAKVAVEARRTVHRAGEPVVLQVTGAEEIPATANIIVTATVNRKVIASRALRLSGRRAEVIFPVQPEFARLVTFVAWSPDSDELRPGFAVVVYPDHTPLRVATAADRREYKPGESGTLTVRAADLAGKPVEAALGIALVDQAVLERARTDQEFGARPWFACAYCSDDGEADIGGVRLNDLISHTGPVPPDLDLAAEALAARLGAALDSNRSDSLQNPPTFESIKTQAQRWKEGLDRYHAESFAYPRDGADLARVLRADWLAARDPWDQPYSARFSYSGRNFTIDVRTAGPDKKSGTEDDFTAASFDWPYFRPAERLIQEILSRQSGYPGTPEEFVALLRDNGLDLERLRDPWGSPYRAKVLTHERTRHIEVDSNGPDRLPETGDDAMVSLLSGSYFIHGRAISRALHAATPPPRTEAEFRQALAAAKIDIDSLRDAWGRAYTIQVKEEAAFADRVVTRNVRVFGQEEITKEDHIPVSRRTTVFRLHSTGPDGKPASDDDFDIATFPVFASEEAARKDAMSPPALAAAAGGETGDVAGRVADVTGAGIPNAAVVLIASNGGAQRTLTQEDGFFRFASVPVGTYSLVADLTGFVRHETLQLPVDAGKVTSVEIELRVGAVTEQVQVNAEPVALNTSSSMAMSVGPTSTPRVREFFPETSLWLPEVITNAHGVAKVPVRFADSITTWKLAVFASTLDGRTATVESDIRVFQPFFLDFDLPKVLTQGDRIELPVSIRNYLTRTARVQLDARAGAGLSLPESRAQALEVPAEGSRNVPLALTAASITREASLRATAKGGRDGDAVERRVRIQPDGREVRTTSADLASGTLSLPFSIPRDAIPGSTSAELRIYPNVGSLLIESAASVLTLPRGCAEQLISAGYANLVAWRFAKSSGLSDARLEERLLQNVRAAVDGIGQFRLYSGAFSYWGEEPDTAVTAHALAFLIEASEVTGRDEHRIESAAQYLEKAQQKDGRWIDTRAGPVAGERISLLLTAAVARSLALAVKSGVKVDPKVLTGAYHHLAKFTDSVDEPYLLARFLSAVLDSGDRALAANAAARLQALAREERGATYWDLQTNTPFYGWGTAGRVETTGAVVSALAGWRAANPADRALDPLLRRAIVFLVRQRRSGYWPSTQSTLLAMRAIADAAPVLGVASRIQPGPTFAVRLDGKAPKAIGVPRGAVASDPIVVPWDAGLSTGEHQAVVEAPQLALVSLTFGHSVAWTGSAPPSPDLRFSVEFTRLDPRAGENVRCKVHAERVGFRGYGMLIAEVGLPPGAEVDRASLEKVADRYEILPDRVVFYLWPSAGGVTFEFDLGMRFPMTAKSAASVLYDYSNPETRAVVPPSPWRVNR